ncbi:glycosyltransferase family 9 protein [Micromonospora sp. CPCC 205546]|uniref:glycosyltransferase family 9 protein n=1 Tax=Micromonospora sp. CPCC 205546 TaxID=3122397 RepID=UPI002FF1949D
MILALRALGVGDLVTATPALRALRAAYPDRELVLAAPGWLAPLLDLVGGVDRLVPTDGLGSPAPTPPAPHAAVNLHGRGPESHRLLAGTRPGRLLAYANPEAGHHDGPSWRADEHEVDRWCRLLDWYGISADRTDLDLRRPAPGGVPTGATVLHPGAKVPAKRWPPGRFAALARELAARGHRVVLTGSRDERATARRIAADAGLPPDAVLAGRTDLGRLAALVAYARLVVSGDTGVAHLATGYRTPSVVLFGPVSPALWGPPPGRSEHRALWRGEQDWPRWDGVGSHPTLAAVGVDEVMAAVDDVERTVRVSGAAAT